MVLLNTRILKRTENPLKKFWSWEMLETCLKSEHENREDDEDYFGEPVWLPWYKIILNFTAYLVLLLLITIVVLMVNSFTNFVAFVILLIQRLRKTSE